MPIENFEEVQRKARAERDTNIGMLKDPLSVQKLLLGQAWGLLQLLEKRIARLEGEISDLQTSVLGLQSLLKSAAEEEEA